MIDQTAYRNGNTSRLFLETQLSVLQVIRDHSHGLWKERSGSARGRYSMQCPLPNHADRQHPDYSGSFSVDVDERVCICFGCGWSGNAWQLCSFKGSNAAATANES